MFSENNLFTANGLPVKIIHPGNYNNNAGPDFFDARIVIDGTEWAGNIEIHLDASMWYSHRHHLDKAYNNVVLHVVARFDREVHTESGRELETLIIKPEVNVLRRFKDYMESRSGIVCREDLKDIDSYYIRHWINKLAISRIEDKTRSIKDILEQTGSDWEETLYIVIAKAFGLKVNTSAFYELALKLPLKLIRKHSDNPVQVEALLFGQAGLLETDILPGMSGDKYFDLLCREYRVLGTKYSLRSMTGVQWKFHRTRPANFPTLRISQLADLLIHEQNLFNKIINTKSVKALYEILHASASDYWLAHTRFGLKTRRKGHETGKLFLDSIIINSLVPFIFLWGSEHSSQVHKDRAIDFLDKIPPENNRIIREWSDAGVEAVNALDTQGLTELRDHYCKNRECLNCHIGSKLISLGKNMDPEGSYSLEDKV